MDQLERWRTQLEEVEVVESLFVEEDEVDIDAVSKTTIEQYINDGNVPNEKDSIPYLKWIVYLKEFQVKNEIPELICTMPTSYPDKEPIQVSMFLSSIDPSELERLNDTLIDLATSLVGEMAFLEVYQKARQLLLDIKDREDCLRQQEEELKFALDEEKAQAQDQLRIALDKIKISRCTIPVLGRRAIYFHHIIAKNKRQVVINWAVQLELGGFSKTGWPGIVIVEGPEYCAQEYVRRLQHLRWKQMVVRGEQIEKGAEGQSYDDLRKLPRCFREFQPDAMSELAAACRAADLEELFLTTMKIYKRK